jgi:hypothetical protein
MKAGTLWDAARAGHPAVITVGVLLLLFAVGSVFLWRARRPIPAKPRRSRLTSPKRGKATVDEIAARLDAERLAYEDELLAKINAQRMEDLRQAAEQEAAARAAEADRLAVGEVTEMIPAIAAEAATESIPAPRTPPRRTRPYLRMLPRPVKERAGATR